MNEKYRKENEKEIYKYIYIYVICFNLVNCKWKGSVLILILNFPFEMLAICIFLFFL